MNNPKVPTPIVDKNGKKTTVHRNIDSQKSGGNRPLPKPKAPKTPYQIVEGSLRRSKMKMSEASTIAVLRVMSEPRSDRYDRLVATVKRVYKVDDLVATRVSDFLFRDAGLKKETNQISHSERMRTAGFKILAANHKRRFPAAGSTPVAQPEPVESDAVVAADNETEDEFNARIAGLSGVELINAINQRFESKSGA